MLAGYVVPFLGAGVNLVGRPEGEPWTTGQTGQHLPSGSQLAEHLAVACDFPKDDERRNLQRVSQYLQLRERGWGPLYFALRTVFDADYPPGPVHELLARLAALLQAQGRENLLVVTTNYDDALERAYSDRKPPLSYDTVWYMAEGPHSGKFVHQPPGEDRAHVIPRPNRYTAVGLDARPVILKLHGAVNRKVDQDDSYVITEDHYIDYLRRSELEELVPSNLLAALRKSKFLFLGYGLNDWNFRVILKRIQQEQSGMWTSEAVQKDVDDVEAEFWRARRVDLVKIDLGDYVTAMAAEIDGRFGPEVGPLAEVDR